MNGKDLKVNRLVTYDVCTQGLLCSDMNDRVILVISISHHGRHS